MALQKEHTAFGRIVQFDDNKTEQVWDVFRDEFGRASMAEDGVTGWKIAEGMMQIEEIDKKMSEADTAKIISDIALSTSSNIQIASSWISNKKESSGQLTDVGVLMARSAAYQILAKYREILLNSLLVEGSEAHKTMIDLARQNSRLAVPLFFNRMQTAHGRKARELVAAYTAMIMRQQIIPVSDKSDVLKDLMMPKVKGEDQFPSFRVFNPQIHTTTTFFMELDRIRAKLARVQQSADGPLGAGVQDQDVGEALITALEVEEKYEMVLFEYRQTIKSRVQVQISENVGTRGQAHERSEAEEAASQAQDFDQETSSSSLVGTKTVDLSRVGLTEELSVDGINGTRVRREPRV